MECFTADVLQFCGTTVLIYVLCNRLGTDLQFQTFQGQGISLHKGHGSTWKSAVSKKCNFQFLLCQLLRVIIIIIVVVVIIIIIIIVVVVVVTVIIILIVACKIKRAELKRPLSEGSSGQLLHILLRFSSLYYKLFQNKRLKDFWNGKIIFKI